MRNKCNVRNRELAMAFSFILLYGCATKPIPNPTPLPIVQPDQEVVIPPDILKKCAAMPHLQRKVYTQQESVKIVAQWQNLYSTCSSRQRQLSDIARKAFNIPNTGVLGINGWSPPGTTSKPLTAAEPMVYSK